MKLIAHRGNTAGINEYAENSPDYLKRAINLGYDIEIDARIVDDRMWLGHDEPRYKLSYEDYMFFLTHREVWWHSKDYSTLANLINRGPWMKVFAHETDKYGLVNGGYVWTADTTIELEENNRTVFMVPGSIESYPALKDKKPYGICTDDFAGLLVK